MSTTNPPAKSTNIAAWAIQILLAVAFFAAAGAKLAGAPMLVAIFQTIGLGQWFRYVTAVVEISGAIALLVPGFAVAGGVWLGTTMVFAVITHLLILHTNPAPAVVLAVLSFTVAWLRSGQIGPLLAKFG